jgi:hypothetical protein
MARYLNDSQDYVTIRLEKIFRAFASFYLLQDSICYNFMQVLVISSFYLLCFALVLVFFGWRRYS